MTGRLESVRTGLAGWLMLLFGVAAPGLIAIIAALVPSLEWVQGPDWATGSGGRALLVGAGTVLCAGVVGFVMRKTWAWWIVVLWGLYCVVEIARDAIANPLVITISAPQVIAVAFIGPVWQVRRQFGVTLGGRNE